MLNHLSACSSFLPGCLAAILGAALGGGGDAALPGAPSCAQAAHTRLAPRQAAPIKANGCCMLLGASAAFGGFRRHCGICNAARHVARRHVLLDELERVGHFDLSDVVRALVRPVAAKLTDPDGGRDFIRINAQLVALHTVHVRHAGPSPLKLPANDRFTLFLERALAGQELPVAVLKQRAMLAAVLLFHGLADHLRMLELADTMDASMDTELFLGTLEDSIVAVLRGPSQPSDLVTMRLGQGRGHGG
jgi:hypothetical protein